MESVFVEETEMDISHWTNFDSEYQKLKIGEIFQLKDSSLSMTCTNCWQEFQFFTEFSLHIQEHYSRGEIAHLKDIKEEPPIEKERETFIISDEDDEENDFDDGHLPITAEVECELKDGDMFENTEMDMGWSDNDFNDTIHSIFEANTKTEQSENAPELQKRINFVEGTDYEKNDNGFSCLTCGREIAKWKHFKEHLQTHSNQKEVACPICSKLFASVSYVRKHCVRTHKIKMTSQKIKAAQTTTTTTTTTTTKTIKATTTKYEPMMERLATKPNDVKKTSYEEGVHYKKVNEKFHCMKCDRQMAKLDHMKEHLITHKTEKNVYCPFCASAFITESYVRKHVNRTHKLKITGEEIKTAQSSINISRVKKEWETVKDKTIAKVASERIGHISCLFCVKKFTKARYAQKHMRLIHAKPMSINEVKNAQPNKCELNNESMNVKDDEPRLPKNFECYICHKLFTRHNSLQTHMKLHSGTKYVCPYCDRLFAMKAYVRDHISIVHGIKAEDIRNESIKQASCTYVKTPVIDSYECYLCKKTFEARANLRKHMRSHLLGPFLCVTCGAIYKSITYFRYHMRLHQADPNIRYDCSDASCNKNYKTKHHMMRHYRKYHLGIGYREPKTKKLKSHRNNRNCSEN